MKPYMRHLARIHREFTARTLLSFLLSFTSFVGSRARERSAFLVDDASHLVGIVTEGDFLRRPETGTPQYQRQRG